MDRHLIFLAYHTCSFFYYGHPTIMVTLPRKSRIIVKIIMIIRLAKLSRHAILSLSTNFQV